VPFWDARNDFGNTTLIVAKPEEGASLARALGPNWIVLMRRHGATVAGTTLEELVFRTVYTARNAALQIEAHGLGHVSPLNAAETELAGEYNLRPGPVARAWEYWSVRLDKAEGTWRRPKARFSRRRFRGRELAGCGSSCPSAGRSTACSGRGGWINARTPSRPRAPRRATCATCTRFSATGTW